MNFEITSEPVEDEYDSSSSAESTPRNSFNAWPSQVFESYRGPAESTINDYLLPSLSRHATSRSFASSSSSASDSESESNAPFLPSRRRRLTRRHLHSSPSWWNRHSDLRSWRYIRRSVRNILRSPFCPRQPLYIVLALVLFCVFAVLLTLLLMYILNPDKQPLPWRAYCAVPPASLTPGWILSPPSSLFHPSEGSLPVQHHMFPPPNFDTLPPAGVFVGVFSMDSSFERRMLIRTTYASHPRSRNGAGDGDGGAGTSRTVVRFIMGLPRKDWDRRVQLEMETYKDIVILPIAENMNNGKSHSFFTWSASHAWVPPPSGNATSQTSFSYSNETMAAPSPASHDPVLPVDEQLNPLPWVRPDFVVKVDDDAFVMLAELEGRLRNELHLQLPQSSNSTSTTPLEDDDPLIYWGYLVTNRLHRFMAGELYALSWRLVSWIATDPTVKTMVNGAEDKQTSKWMRIHPRARDIRWTSERCWIYDHPRAGSVYGHGFLFPSERTRIRRKIMHSSEHNTYLNRAIPLSGNEIPTPPQWAESSVSTFRTRYEPPVPGLSTAHSVEALVEGSPMSELRHGAPLTPNAAWSHREGRRTRYEGKRLGGTIVVHYIKKHMWFIETAMSLLQGDEFTPAELELLSWRDGQSNSSNESIATLPPVSHKPTKQRRLK